MTQILRRILVGCLPLAAGAVLNTAVLNLPISGMTMFLIGLACIWLWGAAACWAASPGEGIALQALTLSAPGLVMLALVLYQEIILGAYWPGLPGTVSQFFFLPLLSVVLTLTQPLVAMWMETLRLWPFYILAWLCLLAAAWFGCWVRSRR